MCCKDKEMKVCHIKENWETHQILTNTETILLVNGGPHILRGVDIVTGDYKDLQDLKSCQSEFRHNPLMWTL